MELAKKIEILAAAARYDVSCASSGSSRKNRPQSLGNAAPGGICHTFTEDGRCVSLLKILYTNVCVYDCAYCVNRCSNDIPRSAFTVEELVQLTMNFYRRNYIEGLFLSSGVRNNPDATMERLIRVARELRRVHRFQGYIHLKCVPNATPALVQEAGEYADRLSVNIELPSEESLRRLAAQKSYAAILGPMGVIKEEIAQRTADRKRLRSVPLFAPAGQSTQLVIGASPESDYEILRLARDLYHAKDLKRVYYSAYVPANTTNPHLASIEAPPLLRENRLYQADWLLRLYGFSLDELVSEKHPELDKDRDPKMSYALTHPERFPVDVNRDDYELLLRVPGIGLQSARTIVQARRHGTVRLEYLKKMGVVLKRARPFIRCPGLEQRSASVLVPAAVAVQEAERRRSGPAETREGLRRIYLYDGNWDGLLTVVFESYARKEVPQEIVSAGEWQAGLFDDPLVIETDVGKADRVWKGLGEQIGKKGRRECLHAFLSGVQGIEMSLLEYIKGIYATGSGPGGNAYMESALRIRQTSRQVRREAHRMRGLVRFERVSHDLFAALVSPRYDVLPLIRTHFERRYADQQWIIYDTRRHYGLFWDQEKTGEIRFSGIEEGRGIDGERQDGAYPHLWRKYFQSITIPERRNPKLHCRQLPSRYWKYLPEKRKA